jgi:hypothetical protein
MEDGDLLSEILSTKNLANWGRAATCIPAGVDPAMLYRFRTDIFWGWPNDYGELIDRSLVDLITGFLSTRASGVVVSESWTGSIPDWEESGNRYFVCSSKLDHDTNLHCRFLLHEHSTRVEVGRFLHHNDKYPLLLVDLSEQSQVHAQIKDEARLSREALEAIVGSVTQIIVDVYDGRAQLRWRRMSQPDLKQHWEQSSHR